MLGILDGSIEACAATLYVSHMVDFNTRLRTPTGFQYHSLNQLYFADAAPGQWSV